MYRWTGWYDGSVDCEPPEPGKYWLEIESDVTVYKTSFEDPMFEEFCVIVHRTDNFKGNDSIVMGKENRAQLIVEALNMWEDA